MEPVFQTAWQPFTPRGAGRFAHAPTWRLLIVQLVFALLAAAAVTWCVRTAWFPVVEEAVQKLPETGEVRAGRLQWVAPSPQRLAENRFLSLVVDLEHSGELRGAAHVSVELGTASVQVFALFGFVDLPYPRGWGIALNRPETWPWWGAWSPAMLAAVFLGTVAGLLLAWAVLALVYCVPAWLLGFVANRDLDLHAAWRLCGAAQLPGALCLTGAVVAYGLDCLDPVRLVVAFGVHLLVSWLYLVASPLLLPPAGAAAGGNPFAGGPGEPKLKQAQGRSENPFGSAGN